MWLKTVYSLGHSMKLWCELQPHVSFAGLEAGVTRLWMRPLVCNVCAACGTYVVI
jgi:hypothetical protein